MEYKPKVGDLIGVSDGDLDSALHTYVDNERFNFYYTGGKDRKGNHIVETVQLLPAGYEISEFEAYKYISEPLFNNRK